MSRSASADLRNLYGPGLSHRLQQQARGENGPPNLPAAEDEDDDPTHVAKGGQSQHMTMSLKRRRQSTLLKEILKSGGYGDLAKMASFHKG